MKMTAKAAPAYKIFSFNDYRATPDPIFDVDPACLQPFPVPIIIDNGSFQTRAGWASTADELSAPLLQFKTVAARSRGAARSETQIGNDISNLEPLRWLLKSQFDRNVVVNFEIQELMLDYIFMHLGIDTEGSVDHPVVLTEAPCNPLHCRQMMSELLFECYRIPQVSYGVDALYSFNHNSVKQGVELPLTGMVISSGYHCSHILPMINGRLDAGNCKRVNVGGSHAASYLQRLLQLKYPGHLAAVTLSRMEELLHEHCYIAEDYQEELEKWRSPEFYEREVHRLQLPYSSKLLGGSLSAEERQEKRAQQLRRLQELNARRREERLLQDQERLDTLLSVQELWEDGHLEQFHRRLVELNMDSAEELQSYISKLSLAVEQGRQHTLHSDGPDSKSEVSELDEGYGVTEMESDLTLDSADGDKPLNTAQPVFNMAEYHQLFVGTERLRVPEVLFQPSLIGEEQMGLMEVLQFVLDRSEVITVATGVTGGEDLIFKGGRYFLCRRYTPAQQEALVRSVFLTGGNMQYAGMKERVERELLAMRPFQSHFQVSVASRPALDAWYGARDWALRHTMGGEGWMSRQDYEEKGGEYLSEHWASNAAVSIRIARPSTRVSETLPVGPLLTPATASTVADVTMATASLQPQALSRVHSVAGQ